MGWWLQFWGILLTLIGGLCTLWGFVISPEQTVINSIRNYFSQTQSIRVLPPSLGGIDYLNLDNVARLKLYVPYSANSVTLLLDIVPTSPIVRTSPNVVVEGAQIYNQSLGVQYVFDTGDNKRHEIAVGGRTFVVTLLQINRLGIPNVGNPLEYVFGISER
jgi:hypothetical protein